MSNTAVAVRPAFRCLRCTFHLCSTSVPLQRLRSLVTTASTQAETSLQSSASSPPPDSNIVSTPRPERPLDPRLVSTPKQERRLIQSGVQPIGSRRRRAALGSLANIPFERLPYQCFQEARKVLRADREDKLRQIEVQRQRIAKAQALDPAQCGGEFSKKGKVLGMQKYLEELKILADINDPVIKKRFEDGQGKHLGSDPMQNLDTAYKSPIGDMNRPIYRYLADRKWREYRRKLIVQRVTQMSVVPDLLPHLDPVAEVKLAFRRRNVQPGDFVDSRVSEIVPKLDVQVFDKGERFVSIVVVDPDVPNLETDGFDNRCHFLATNVSISPAATSLPLSRLSKDTQVLLPWLPPFAQKGSPYHRMAVFVLQHQEGATLDVPLLQKKLKRDGFSLRNFITAHKVKPIGVYMFRSQWDEGTADVMQRAGIEGAHLELRRKRVEPLPYKKKDGARYR
ncbi:hypothetical protein MMC20_006979 [Loxospora ochrophaea]|nr:hypothetical protein [Loxospora ochrophaea]